MDGGRELRDVGRIVHGVLSAAGARASGDVPLDTPSPQSSHKTDHEAFVTLLDPLGSRQAESSDNEEYYHMLMSMHRYLSRLESGGLPSRLMAMMAMAPRVQGQGCTFRETLPMETSLCKCLVEMTISEELARQTLALCDTMSAGVRPRSVSCSCVTCFGILGSCRGGACTWRGRPSWSLSASAIVECRLL